MRLHFPTETGGKVKKVRTDALDFEPKFEPKRAVSDGLTNTCILTLDVGVFAANFAKLRNIRGNEVSLASGRARLSSRGKSWDGISESEKCARPGPPKPLFFVVQHGI